MLNYKKMIWAAIIAVLIAIVFALLPACEKKKAICVTDVIANIIGCNSAHRCRVELKDGTAGWTRDPVTSTTVTVCHKDL